ncbi:MAG: TIGR03936 family radical SAM-associated protein [Dehalococcoidia bacterium]|nr:TIGR03936 family radical SAM-associated protein [Dehalococcoidia bacterium]
MQRWRLEFSREEELKFLSHLDLMRLWERLLRRALVPLAYSQGFSPHPQISLALPLPLGVTSDAELLDIRLTRPLPLDHLTGGLKCQSPNGLVLGRVQPVPPRAPSLPSLVLAAEYRVEGEGNGVAEATAALLDADRFPWQHRRERQVRHYDLRPLVEGLRAVPSAAGVWVLEMRLKAGPAGTGRADQVALAVGLRPHHLHRTRIFLEVP